MIIILRTEGVSLKKKLKKNHSIFSEENSFSTS